ncbi:hypothetical protein NQ176_g3385 [Zarea fungicola]|uniref:Uncharacterized protein n=1 Tax=Zarea fungicola TaxID=93591 RepID=A0ACC1NLB0_9HYPO|nr:hypothetical protein NQ176_g3385 [Lecanicillium fungicola]
MDILSKAQVHNQCQHHENLASHHATANNLTNHQIDANFSYSDVSVQSLIWNGDSHASFNIHALHNVFESKYHFRTVAWEIPKQHANTELAIHLSSFLKHAKRNQLFIIYYCGHAYHDSTGELILAWPDREKVSKVKWKKFCYLIECAKCDIILFLCTSSTPSRFHSADGVKQIISAHCPDQLQEYLPAIGYTFTRCLVDTLDKMYDSTPFSTQRLFNEFSAALSNSKYCSSTFHPPYPRFCPQITTSGNPGNITIAPQRPRCITSHEDNLLEEVIQRSYSVPAEDQHVAQLLMIMKQDNSSSDNSILCLSPLAANSSACPGLPTEADTVRDDESRPVDGSAEPAHKESDIPSSQSNGSSKDDRFLRRDCLFRSFGCRKKCKSKKEWKQHMDDVHMRPTYYNCNRCEGFETSRQDHLKRHFDKLHNSDSFPEMEKNGPQSREPPQGLKCPKPKCDQLKNATWEEWKDHVGMHIFKGQGNDFNIDDSLRERFPNPGRKRKGVSHGKATATGP